MIPFFLYLIAGVVTGFHVYSLLALTALGAPSHPLEFVSLMGSFGLVVAAYLSLFKPHTAARLALLASLAIWCFYGPAIAHAVEARWQRQRSELFLDRAIPRYTSAMRENRQYESGCAGGEVRPTRLSGIRQRRS
jgi:hypothetical protein